ncbi:hypothetical protein [Streptomyces antimycoticus]|uniref:hypothetical protein n=1 Tax=Streptomyces antimycoticus TaxID=68175 RepID=UPI0036E17F30
MAADRCPAAHAEDPTPRDGGQVVRVVDQQGTGVSACIHHGARLYASLIRPRVYPLAGHDGAAIEVYNLARVLRPFPWVHENGYRGLI